MRSVCIAAWMGIFLLGTTGNAPAQSREIIRLRSSLSGLGEGTLTDSGYVDTMNRLVHLFYGTNSDSAFHYAHLALEYAGRTHYRKGESESWRMLGNTFEMVGDYLNMLSSYQHSLDIAEAIGSTSLIGKAKVNIALFYKQEGEFDQAQRLMEEVQTFTNAAETAFNLPIFLLTSPIWPFAGTRMHLRCSMRAGHSKQREASGTRLPLQRSITIWGGYWLPRATIPRRWTIICNRWPITGKGTTGWGQRLRTACLPRIISCWKTTPGRLAMRM